MSEVPTGKELRVEKAIPYASQVMNDSNYSGKYVDDALNNLYTTVGVRLRAVAEDLDLKTEDDEVSIALDGAASDAWTPTFVVVKITSASGTPGTAASLRIGTASDGEQVLATTALTGLTTLNGTFLIAISGLKDGIAANATLYARTHVAAGTITTLVADVYIYGEIL